MLTAKLQIIKVNTMKNIFEKKKGLLFNIIGATIVFLLVLSAFFTFVIVNKNRIVQRNKSYATTSAQQIVKQVQGQFKNALQRVKISSYIAGSTSKDGKPNITAQNLVDMESESLFDDIRFLTLDGRALNSEGEYKDVTNRTYYIEAMKGNSGIDFVLDSQISHLPLIVFYSPIFSSNKEVLGAFTGAYYAEEYLKSMITAEYFGKAVDVYLCTREGHVVSFAVGDGSHLKEYKYDDNLIEVLKDNGIIDAKTADKAQKIFDEGGEDSFISNGKTDNLCVITLENYDLTNEGKDFVLVQAFPKTITHAMISDANYAGLMLVATIFVLFVVYIAVLVVVTIRQRKRLLAENKTFGEIMNGLNELFSSKYLLVDLENDRYVYSGVEESRTHTPSAGVYSTTVNNWGSTIVDDEGKEEFYHYSKIETIIEDLAECNSVVHETHVEYNGKEDWENIIIVCVERKEGKAAKVLCVRQNITDKKMRELKAQNQIAVMNRKERQYRSAITSTAFCSFEFNLTKDLVDSEIYCQINGNTYPLIKEMGLKVPCKASDVFAKWKKLVTSDTLENYNEAVNVATLNKLYKSGKTEVEVDYWREGVVVDDKLCIRHSFFLAKDEVSGDVMVMSVMKNITEYVRKQHEQTRALQDALMQAQHANIAKTTFLSNMSHDIRTPMNAIIGFATIAATHIENTERVQDSLQKILSSSNHLLSLINDILDMSRIESGKLQLHNQECNLPELMHNLVNIIQPQIKAKKMELFIDTFGVVNEDVIADPLKLNQIFINIMSNAVKYTPAGGMVSFRIEQNTNFKHGWSEYVFTIKDNGIGMSKEFVKHIFEPFERETTVTKSGIQGAGLGMAITKNIVDLIGGEIIVESEVGKGSTFIVKIPLQLQDTEKTAEQIKELSGLRSMVVDDDLQVCDSVSKMLKMLGMRAEWTTSGREAVYRAKAAHSEKDGFNTFIIDWHMPDMNGVETTRQIRKAVGKDAPIIILTAYDWTDIEEEAREAGVTAFCAKPLFMSDLKSALISANNLDGKKKEESQKVDFNGKRVLLVEDNEMNREIAQFILEDAGFVVETAPDGTDAVAAMKKAKEGYYDVILMDVQMPIMNGYEATRTIRVLPRQDVKTLPIIAMTANAMEDDKAMALKSGMNAHIAKPLDIDHFLEVLKQFLM